MNIQQKQEENKSIASKITIPDYALPEKGIFALLREYFEKKLQLSIFNTEDQIRILSIMPKLFDEKTASEAKKSYFAKELEKDIFAKNLIMELREKENKYSRTIAAVIKRKLSVKNIDSNELAQINILFADGGLLPLDALIKTSSPQDVNEVLKEVFFRLGFSKKTIANHLTASDSAPEPLKSIIGLLDEVKNKDKTPKAACAEIRKIIDQHIEKAQSDEATASPEAASFLIKTEIAAIKTLIEELKKLGFSEEKAQDYAIARASTGLFDRL
jgi:hypothetical protein